MEFSVPDDYRGSSYAPVLTRDSGKLFNLPKGSDSIAKCLDRSNALNENAIIIFSIGNGSTFDSTLKLTVVYVYVKKFQ